MVDPVLDVDRDLQRYQFRRREAKTNRRYHQVHMDEEASKVQAKDHNPLVVWL